MLFTMDDSNSSLHGPLYLRDVSIRRTSFGWIKINQRTYAAANPVTSESGWNPNKQDFRMLAQRQNITYPAELL